MNLRINVGVISKLKQAGFYPDNMFSCLFILRALSEENYDLLDFADDTNKSKRMILLYYELLRKGLVQESMDTKMNFSITDMGRALLENVNLELEQEPIESTSKKDEVESWFDEWLNLFPEDIKSGGKVIKSDYKSTLARMKQFVKDYSAYSKDTIFTVTKQYLEERCQADWQYTRCAIYFINKKGEGSDLAALCSAFLNGKQTVKEEQPIYNSGLI